LAIGTEFSETDYDFFFLGDLNISGTLVRIDIEHSQLYSNVKPDIPLLGDAKSTCAALLAQLNNEAPQAKSNGEKRAKILRAKVAENRPKDYQAFFDQKTTKHFLIRSKKYCQRHLLLGIPHNPRILLKHIMIAKNPIAIFILRPGLEP